MKMKESIYHIYMSVMFLMMLWSLIMFFYLMNNEKSIFLEWELFFFNGSSIIFLLLFDWMSLMFMFTVSLISMVICGYSKYYMMGDKHYLRFMMILLLFVSSMILLVLSPNLISLLLGWDGLGLSSYILVVYYQNEYACNSGMLTILSNRIGDSMILICICLMYSNGSWNFLLETVSSKLLMILLILGAMTKSAQVPFSAWLPAAMAAPTPVSALVHSSTLVTAGVYLLIRFYPCWGESSIFNFLLISSSITMVMSGWMANFEMDMKKIIALSTLSQLGLMMMIISLGQPELAFFHLITHAMFKSTIFMCAGVMIHNMNGSQDLRLSGNFFISGPFLGLYFAISNLSLCGFPFLAGFFSKDLLLESILSQNMNLLFIMMSMIGTGLTVSYSFRVMYFMSNKIIMSSNTILNEMSFFLMKIIIIMIFMSMMSGFFFSWLALPSFISFINLTNFSKYCIMMIMVIFFFMMLMWSSNEKLSYNFKMIKFFKGSHLMMFLPMISSQYFSLTPLKESYKLSKSMDSGWLEYFLGMMMYKNFNHMNYIIIFSQVSKFLKIFLTSLFLSVILMMNFM
uniref:NADH-ubiquinone oxidoreductase chain 5 n=1 Tax=Metacrangonyx ilvanus TaxID=931575 RepID=K7ZW38_9CRUS|nr:NADH dehydrogenase subunit 5 [Metacrangonyx ilvanus]CCI69553.1 NADH dehydrogenase subunit 5 [Metacrangonyx ilvanus]